jgi:MYXO-CTERM domain-containing protein
MTQTRDFRCATLTALLTGLATLGYPATVGAADGEVGLAPAQAVCAAPELRDTAERLQNLCPNGLCGLDVIQHAESQIDRDRLLTLTGLPESRTVNVLFKFARSTFTVTEVVNHDAAEAGLDSLVRTYKGLPTAKIFVLGRASTVRGTVERNLVRSRLRMLSVANYVADRGVAESDIHVAYFGASAHQLSLSELGDLGISEESLGAPSDSAAHRTAQLNQSVQAFIWPCTTGPVRPSSACGADPASSGSPYWRTAAPGYRPPCASRITSTPEQPSYKVALVGGNAGDLLRRYFATLDAIGVSIDEAQLQVYFTDPEGKNHAETAPERGFAEWLRSRTLRDLWIEKLAASEAVLATDSSEVGDFVCGLNLPVVARKPSGCGCGVAEPVSSSAGWASSLALLLALALRRRSVTRLPTETITGRDGSPRPARSPHRRSRPRRLHRTAASRPDARR